MRGYPSIIRGTVKAPQSKSFAIRLLFLSFSSKVKLRDLEPSEDVVDAINAIKLLGVKEVGKNEFEREDKVVEKIRGSTFIKASATTLRFLLSFLSVLGGENVKIRVGETLKRRPITELVEALKDQVNIEQEDDVIRVNGKLNENYVKISGSESSQYISGFILAFAQTEGGVIEITSNEPTSKSFIYLTIDLINSLGGDIKIEDDGKTIIVKKASLKQYDNFVPGDYALASFYAISSAVTHGEITIFNLPKPPKYFGDHSIIKILSDLGITSIYNDGKWYVTNVETSPSRDLEINIKEAPDLAMSIASLIPLTKRIVLHDVKNLKIKESDRLKGIITTITSFGYDVKLPSDNTLVIENNNSTKVSATIDCNNDHRIAMMATPLIMKFGGEIRNAECVNKSNPKFWQDILSLGGKIEIAPSL
ncbi:MAG: 3-phosphoshikimate 1-carboxyvinyltransferase [Sulfolobaceae archaeon]|nr:3-phosphoshikimate 1-carboxyvinyltransferase [Sulfolobaceae archaeon]